jgi:hypothetical protein
MKTKRFFLFGLPALLLALSLGLAGCESTDWATFSNSYTNAVSSTSETGLVYTIYNRSSVEVTLYDSTGTLSIAPGEYAQARFNRNATINDVSYSPSSVSVSQSGASFTFTD